MCVVDSHAKCLRLHKRCPSKLVITKCSKMAIFAWRPTTRNSRIESFKSEIVQNSLSLNSIIYDFIITTICVNGAKRLLLDYYLINIINRALLYLWRMSKNNRMFYNTFYVTVIRVIFFFNFDCNRFPMKEILWFHNR